MAKATETRSLRARLLDAQIALNHIPLDGYNQHHKYKFASAEGIITACRSVLHTHGLMLRRGGWKFEGSPESGIVTSSMLLDCPETGESIAEEIAWVATADKGRPIDKCIAAALTTSLGYYLRDLLLVPRDDEDESMDRRDDQKYEPRRTAPVATKPAMTPQAVATGAPAAPARAAAPPPARTEQEPRSDAKAPAGAFKEVIGMRPAKDAAWHDATFEIYKIGNGSKTKNGNTRWGILTRGPDEQEEWASCFDEEIVYACEQARDNRIPVQLMIQTNQYGRTLYGIRSAVVQSEASEQKSEPSRELADEDIPF
jgi:hypothetical protein